MKIELAKTAGFCFGVNRAVNILYEMVEKGEKVCTLGPIIHNPQVTGELQSKGVEIAETPSQVPKDAKLVLRTHGVTKQTVEELDRLGIEYIDAACPFVLKIHKLVSEHSTPDTVFLIAGDADHPEVCGFRSRCVGESHVFKTADELEKISAENAYFPKKKIFCLAQTTFSIKEWKKSSKIFKKLYTNGVIFDTICSATNERQIEAEQLAQRSDAMIVIGGRHSSNTAKLRDLCAQHCTTYLIESADELEKIDFSSCRLIGVTAGASTPAGIIKEVLFTMSENLNEQTQNSEELSFEEALEENLSKMSTDQKVTGIVVGISPSEIQVDIGRKHAGYIPASEYSSDPTADPTKELKVGDKLDLIIMKTNDAEGTMMLSKRRFDSIAAWDNIIAAEKEGTILEGTVAEVIKGGILVYTNGVRVFVPASLATASKDDDMESLLKTSVKLRIIEVNNQRKRAVGSIRAVLREERKAASDALWASLEVGANYTGTVKSLTSYGAFVDIGGVDGMVHISELSWNRIKHPSEVVNVGDEVTVYIKAFDPEKRKISLGYKRIEDNPWEILKRDYPVGTVIDSKIVGLTTFGAFASVVPGIDGLIHISQIANRRIEKPADVLTVGEEVKVMITEIDFDKKRVSLSIRALLPVEEKPVEEQAEETTGDELVYSTDAPEEFAAVVEQIDKAADETEE